MKTTSTSPARGELSAAQRERLDYFNDVLGDYDYELSGTGTSRSPWRLQRFGQKRKHPLTASLDATVTHYVYLMKGQARHMAPRLRHYADEAFYPDEPEPYETDKEIRESLDRLLGGE